MDSIKPSSAPTKSRLSKAFQKIIHLKTATNSNNGFCLLIPQEKLKCCDPNQQFNKENTDEATKSKNKAFMEAYIAKLFATVSSIKAAYAELQMAQFPYNSEAVQSADQAVVDELKALSELKHSFLNKKIDSSPPHLTLLLAEIQEQQSVMKLYEITMNKMQSEIETKASKVNSLQQELTQTFQINKSIQKKLNASGCFSVLDNVKFSESNLKNFTPVLNQALRSVRPFVNHLVREMESSNWDLKSAANAIQPEITFTNPNHISFAFDSYVCKIMFDGFNDTKFSLPNEALPPNLDHNQLRVFALDQIQCVKSANPIQYLNQNPDSLYGKVVKNLYMSLVHPKMETSFFGNLKQRKMITSGEGFPETEFFKDFAEMVRRVWILKCLAMSFEGGEVRVFQVRKGTRFSQVYMERVVNDDEVIGGGCSGLKVGFTVVPGFKIGKTVVQSRVYLV